MKTCSLLAGVALIALATAASAETYAVASPDGRTSIVLEVDGTRAPTYSVRRDGRPLIAESALLSV